MYLTGAVKINAAEDLSFTGPEPMRASDRPRTLYVLLD
jgi:hypothetical protein